VKYRLAGDEVGGAVRRPRHGGQAYLTDVERLVRLYFTAKDDLEPVPAADLLDRRRRDWLPYSMSAPPKSSQRGMFLAR